MNGIENLLGSRLKKVNYLYITLMFFVLLPQVSNSGAAVV